MHVQERGPARTVAAPRTGEQAAASHGLRAHHSRSCACAEPVHTWQVGLPTGARCRNFRNIEIQLILGWQLEISHGGKFYTEETVKSYKSGLFPSGELDVEAVPAPLP